ncbi:GNAT family N-acetyltransferase [bacterium]|nr:GNAT family N-acetyltransferase [bacterium]
MSIHMLTLKECPELMPHFRALSEEAWPEFLHHAALYRWSVLFDEFKHFQFVIVNEAEEVLGLGHTVPFFWDGCLATLPEGIAEITEAAYQGLQNGHAPNTLCALAAIVSTEFRSQGISTRIIQTMRSLAAEHSFQSLIAPVRPTLKSKHPLVPIDRYIDWKTLEDLPFDPWLRVHVRLGAQFLKIIPQALIVQGSVRDWEEWTGMRFPLSGLYTVPGALVPISIDLRQDFGRYDEPNIWMKHVITACSLPDQAPTMYW